MDITGYAYIVGGGSGIGKDTALAFAKEGAAGVAISDINLDAANEAMKEAKAVATNPNFRELSLHVDVTNEDSVDVGTRQVVDLFGRIDYCLISAGIGIPGAKCTSEVDAGLFKRIMDVNVTGSFLVTKSVGNVMKSQTPTPTSIVKKERAVTRGTIVHMGSSASYTAGPGRCPYVVSKHAVLGLSRVAAIDLVKYGVRVNCLCPGWVETPLIEDKKVGLVNAVKNLAPLGRLALTEETADAVLYLCSPRSSYVNGCGLVMDGGTTVLEPTKASIGYANHDFPIAGLRRVQRNITTFDKEGKSVFLSADGGDHQHVMGDKQAIQMIMYSTRETPVNLNGDVDVEKAAEKRPPVFYPNGTVLRMIDFAPDVEGPMHRVMALVYGVILEGIFELTLDSGEKKILREGDIIVQRAAAHKWKNITGNGTMPGRMLYMLLDIEDYYFNENKVEGYMGALAKEHENEGRVPSK
ncbi:unnamed protein product [Clonostachys solani]|uniref:Uncharacterized protein n=1 Tax=Clonostachys solani TaxID=160281 RepID=A0A9N9Z0J6_9HYPO|nr:unnamed protein product [Clonostachys solani]